MCTLNLMKINALVNKKWEEVNHFSRILCLNKTFSRLFMTVNEKEASKATAAMLLLLSNKNPLKKSFEKNSGLWGYTWTDHVRCNVFIICGYNWG